MHPAKLCYGATGAGRLLGPRRCYMSAEVLLHERPEISLSGLDVRAWLFLHAAYTARTIKTIWRRACRAEC